MNHKFLALFLALIFLWGCSPATTPTAPETTAPTSPTSEATTTPTMPSTVPPVTEPPAPVLAPTFDSMPQMHTDSAHVYLSDHVAIFAFITSGMDSAHTSLVTYDLVSDTVLGQLDLGDDMISLSPLDAGSFAVVSHIAKTFRVFDNTCSLIRQDTLTGIEGEVGIAGLLGNTLLVSEPISGNILLYDLDNATCARTDLTPSIYSFIGTYSQGFLLESYDAGLIQVSADGTWKVLYKKGTAQTLCGAYAAGVRGDYITMLPLLGGDPLMAPCQTPAESFCDGDGMGLLSRSQHWDAFDTLYYYATDSMTVTAVEMTGQVVTAALCDDWAVAVTRTDYESPLEFSFVDFSQHEKELIAQSAYDSGLLNGAKPLPEPTGSTETLALIQRIHDTYGIRLVYEPDIFDLEPVGYTMTPTDEATFREKALLLEEFFRFLPEGLLQEMGESYPVVIYLCQDLHPSAGGMNTILDGYNVSFLSVTGNDDYFLGVAAHEMAHALERGMNIEVISQWRALMPQEAQNAYGQLSLTVEYTPDDKGRTPVWFLDAYGRFSEMEDRAVLFAALFDAWRGNDDSRLQYGGLKLKAQCWADMLRQSYESCRNTVFPWESEPEF